MADVDLKPAYVAFPARGRRRFRQLHFLLSGVSAAMRLLPPGVLRAFWSALDLSPGGLGVAGRYCVLRALAKACGDRVFVGPNVEIRGCHGLEIGSNVSIHRGCYIDAGGGISIGDDVSIAHQTSILSGDHTWEDTTKPIRDNLVRIAPVRIDDDVWIGCGCRILAGVHIGGRSVVAAGAVVTRSVDSHCVVGGVPAKVIRRI